MGGSSGGSGWTSFDLGVLADETPATDQEVNQPSLLNAHNNPYQFLPEPDMDSVKEVLRTRLIINRLGRQNAAVEESELEALIHLKSRILDRMWELDRTPFWGAHKNRLIRDFIQPPRGGEYRIPTLRSKLDSLLGQDPQNSRMYQQLIRLRDSFDVDAPLRGPRGN